MSERDEDFSIDREDLDDSVVGEEHLGDALKKIKEKLKGAEEKAKEYLDGWQRERAEIANARKRDEESRKDFAKFANAGLIEDLIPVLDALELAVGHGERGVQPVQSLFLNILKKNGLEESNPTGDMFDPRLHEAVGTAKVDKESEDHKILEVVQKGYILSGRIIRPAKVRIGEFNN